MGGGELEGRRILVIDDDQAILSVIGEKLRLKGCEVRVAERGPSGLELAREFAPDLIVLDVFLPKMDGFEVLTQLQKDERTASIPVVFVSANDEVKERVRALRLGAVDYVVKPFDIEELLARIDIALRLKAPPAECDTVEEKSTQTETSSTQPVKQEILSNEAFSQVVGRRVEKLDPDRGLLTLAFVRFDQEDLLREPERESLRSTLQSEIHKILRELAPKESILAEIDPLQVGILIPRKNKYGAELILDELRSQLGLHVFKDESIEHHITISCGVSEYPNARIENGKEFEEVAEAALLRAIRRGGDQTVLL